MPDSNHACHVTACHCFAGPGDDALISHVSRRWQTSTASIEKKLGPFTLFLNASNLIDPVRQYSQYDANGNMIYLSEHRAGNFLVMLGARWSL